MMTPEKKSRNRDFQRHRVYTPRNLNIAYPNPDNNGRDKENNNRFRFQNSLVITPNYEISFNDIGGIKYIRNHENRVFFNDDGIFALTNGITKIPVLIKRSINKQSVQKKLIVEEKYNYEEKYEIYKNIILYYEENRVDLQITFNKTDLETKDITTEFSLCLFIPEIDDIITYKKYNGKQEFKTSLSAFSGNSNNLNNLTDSYNNPLSFGSLEYAAVCCGESFMTVYPDKRLKTEYKNRKMCFTASNLSNSQKNYINLKIYLENYRIT